MLNKIIHLSQEALSSYWHVIFGACLLALFVTALLTISLYRRGRKAERNDSRKAAGGSSSGAAQKTVSSSIKRLPFGEYQVLRDVYLTRLDGKGLTRLPYIVVAKSGIFVIQPQRESGHVSGGAKDNRWKVMHGGREHSFTNPILRSAYHARALARYLELPEALVCGIIYFDQEVRFATPQGSNVLTSGLTRFIMSHKAELLTESQVENVLNRLAEVAGNEELRQEYESRNSHRRRRASREATHSD